MRYRQSLVAIPWLIVLALISGCSCSATVKGRPLEMSVEGSAIDRTFQNDIRERTSLLGNVKGWATESTVVVKFDMNTSGWSKINQGYQFMIRLFDKNGQHLTNVVTSELFTAEERLTEDERLSTSLGGGRPLVLLKAKGNTLEYPVSVRDLRDAAMAEVGFFNPRRWGS
jgi:hypothetical protein